MTEVSSNIYDNGSVGDGSLTETIAYPDGNAGTNAVGTARVTLMNYDWRDRLVASQTGLTLSSTGSPVQAADTAYPVVTVTGLDNLGNALYQYTFSGDINGSPISMASTGANSGTGVPDQLVGQIAAATPGETSGNSPNLVAITQNDFDTQNRIFETLTYSVDPTTGNVSQTALTTYTFYGPRGNAVATVSPTGLTTKDVYNGVGELVDVYTTDGGAVNNGGTPLLTYAAATSVASDVVISQTAYGYDPDGNQVETVHAQRFNTDPITGTAAEGALFTFTFGASSLNVTPTGGSLAARIYYSATYYDAADRPIATANAGTNPVGTGGVATPWTRPATAPTASTADLLVTLTNYNPAGEVYQTTDANGNITADFYDSLGRLTETVASYGTLSTDLNQTTLYTYDGLGDQTSMTAEDPSTGNQLTDYVYGVSQSTGSNITSNDLLYQTVYPAAGQTTIVTDGYNALGQVIFTADRNGNVHNYTFDAFGRQISDTVTTLGTNVDGSVRRIDTAYNNQGLPYLLTSYADTGGTTIVNQVENVYNGLGQLTQQYQAVTGAVDVSTTPVVQYTYTDPSNGSRLASMVYPNGRTINYNYGDTGGVLMSNSNAMLDNAIGRLDGIVDGANSGDVGTVLEQYSYLGLSTIVARNHPQTGINLALVGANGSIGSGGDQYVGLDQFGRVVNQNWVNTTGTANTTVDGYTYTYDSNGNVLLKSNVLDSAYNETYTYDSLNRLTSVTRGGASYQSWNLDAQGNWSSFTSNGVQQTRTANAQNQITTISGTASTPVYDANGNMVTDQSGDTLIYDAWNRLVEVKNSAGAVIAQYTYNAQGYAVTATYPQGTSQMPPGTTNYLYYTSSWQLVEVRTGGTAATNVTVQMVWSAAYINAPVLQDTYSAGVIQPNSRLYFLQDANWNTTAVVGYDATTAIWNVVQRYVYSPYGNIIILNPNFTTAPAGTVPMVNNLYQGMALDPVTGLYYERARWYSASLGTWISQDPAGYINGADTYQFVGSDPTSYADPSGLFSFGQWVHIVGAGLATIPHTLAGMFWREPQRLAHDVAHPEEALQATADSLFHRYCHCKQRQQGAYIGVNLGGNLGALAGGKGGSGVGGVQAIIFCAKKEVAFYAYGGGEGGVGWGPQVVGGSLMGGLTGGEGVYRARQYTQWFVGGHVSGGYLLGGEFGLYKSPDGTVTNWEAGLGITTPGLSLTTGGEYYFLLGTFKI